MILMGIIKDLIAMKHLNFTPTPVSSLDYFSKKLGIQLMAKRDDLFIEGGGGSKARMLQYILADVKSKYDVFVTAGGPLSNFNRACALMCSKLGVPMHLVEYTDVLEEYNISLNYFICKLCDVKTTRCGRDVVAETIDRVMASYQDKGLNAKFVYAGGKCIEGFYAYYDAVREVYCQGIGIDDVFVACGTGTTLTGISAGLQRYYPNAKIYAISTARKEDLERPVLLDNMKELNNYLHENYNFKNMRFYDDYLCGGYAKYTPLLMETIKECISHEGMIIDPTYSGKAFYGMTNIIENNFEFFKNHNVLFWNTGGIFNLLSKE